MCVEIIFRKKMFVKYSNFKFAEAQVSYPLTGDIVDTVSIQQVHSRQAKNAKGRAGQAAGKAGQAAGQAGQASGQARYA